MDVLAKRSDRGLTWTHSEEMELLDIWSDDLICEQLAAGGRNMHIFIAISEEMGRRGVSRTPEQCRHKLKRFKMLYNQVKKSPGSVKEKKAVFKYFEKVDEILSRPQRQVTVGAFPWVGDGEDLSEDGTSGDQLTAQGSSPGGSLDYYTTDMFHARAWTAPEVEVLLDIWQDPLIKEVLTSKGDPLNGCTQISETMADSGYGRTAMECRTQMKKLRTLFYACQKQQNTDPDTSPTFPYYEQMNKILSQPAKTPSRRRGRIQFKRRDRDNTHSSSEDTTGSHMPAGSEESPLGVVVKDEDDVMDEEGGGEEEGGGWVGSMILDCQDETPSGDYTSHEYQAQKPKNYWSQEETEALVKVWVVDDIQERLLYKYRNMDVYTDVSRRLAKEGYHRTAEECRCKINALRFHYRNSKPNSNFWAICKQWANFDDFRRIVDDPNKAGVFRRSHDPEVVDSLHENSTSNDVAAFGETSGMTHRGPGIVVGAPFSKVAEEQMSNQEHSQELPPMNVSCPPRSTSNNDKQSSSERSKRKRTDSEEDVPVPKRRSLGGSTRQLMAGVERIVNRSVNRLLQHQRESQQRQLEWEERRLKLTLESEAKRQREQRDHELRMLEMVSQMANKRHCCCEHRVSSNSHSNSNVSEGCLANSSTINSSSDNRTLRTENVSTPPEEPGGNNSSSTETFPNLLLQNGDL